MLKTFNVDKLSVRVFENRDKMGKDAALAISEKIKELLSKKETINMIFAAAPSQNDMIDSLIHTDGIDWSRINAFHMDEYIGLSKDAPQGFGNFLRDRIFSKVNFKSVNYINGQAEDIKSECERYSKLLIENPVDIVCMGVGENGHIAFNDPPVADFNDKALVKEVKLDEICRNQQVNDGCFDSIDKVPVSALTLTIPALVGADYIFCVVPAATKRNAVFSMLRGKISEKCPASILRTRVNAILFCDKQSAQDVLFRKAIITDEATQDFEKACALAKKYNYEAVELRSVWDTKPHELTYGQISQINEIAKKYELKICAISSAVFKCDMNNETEVKEQFDMLEKCVALAVKTGAGFVRIFTFWKNNGIEKDLEIIKSHIAKAADYAKEYGITLVVEQDPSVSVCNSDEMKILFDSLDIENVKVLWDPGNQIYNEVYKVPYPDGYELIKDNICHIHLKDAIRKEDGTPEGVVIGSGMLDVKGILNELLKINYEGFIVQEPHFRIASNISEDKLKLPGGSAFSEGGFEASELCMQMFEKIVMD